MKQALKTELSVIAGLGVLGLLASNKKTLAGCLGTVILGANILPNKSLPSYKNKSIVITGGSRGLGFALAKQFIAEGASVTLIARDQNELQSAKAKLETNNNVFTYVADVTDQAQLEAALLAAYSHYGRIDVLVNNAGIISVGPLDTAEPEDFEKLWSIQLRANINATRWILPHFRQQGAGCIVNIDSIAGLIPVPHMTPYATAKHALAGYSESIATELAQENIQVTTVYPGLMQTGSPVQAIFKGDAEKEYAWFTMGYASPVVSISAQDAAKRIIEGVRHGKTQIVFPWITKLAVLSHALFPETYNAATGLAASFMPKGTSTVAKTGAESKGWLERQIWYAPFRKNVDQSQTDHN